MRLYTVTLLESVVVLSFLRTIHSEFLLRKLDFDNKIIRTFILREMKTYRVTYCSQFCTLDKACVSFFYNKVSNICQIHSVLFITPSDGVNQTGTTYYEVQKEGCPMDFIFNRLHELCYKPFVIKRYSVIEASTACTNDGYVLVRGKSSEAYQHISDQLVASSGYAFANYIIDGNDLAVESEWRFSNTEPMTSFLWDIGEPDNSRPDKDYVYLKYKNGQYRMSDTVVSLDGNYICQLV